MKPGPAISTEMTSGSSSSFGAIASASARGFIPRAWRGPSPHCSQDRRATDLAAAPPRLRGGSGPAGITPSDLKWLKHSVEERSIACVQAQSGSPNSEKGGSSAALVPEGH